MIFADANRGAIYYIEESTFGTTPTSGTTRKARFNGSTLAPSKNTVISDELRDDRMTADVIEVAAMSGGDVNFELSMFAFDDWFEGFLAGTWTRPQYGFEFQGTTVQWGATNRLDITGQDVTDYFVAGRRIKVEGFDEAASNGYFEVDSVALVSGDTQVTVTTSTSVVETGSATTKVMDANDVIILSDTNIRAGTGGNSSFDSNGNDSFASAITAGQLVVGQNIFVEGLGYEEGSVLFNDAGDDGDEITVSDGAKSVTFELSVDATVTTGNVAVTIGGSAAATAANFEDAVNAQRVAGNLDVSATLSTATVTLRNLRVTSDGYTIATDGSITENEASGDSVTVTDFSGGDSGARGFFEITSVTDDEIFVTPAPSTLANSGGLGVTVKGAMLRNPGDVDDITPRSYTIETQFTDIGQYMLQDGMRVGSFNLEIATEAIVTGTFSFMGRESTLSQAATLSDTGSYDVLDAPPFDIVNATTNVGDVKKDGASLATALQSITVNGDATLRNQMKVSSKFPAGIGLGRFTLSGTLVAYFEDETLFDEFFDHDTVSLQWRFVDLDTNYQIWTIPSMKYNSDPVSPEGIDQDVLENIEFQAFRNATLDTQLQIDRFSSINPPTVQT